MVAGVEISAFETVGPSPEAGREACQVAAKYIIIETVCSIYGRRSVYSSNAA